MKPFLSFFFFLFDLIVNGFEKERNMNGNHNKTDDHHQKWTYGNKKNCVTNKEAENTGILFKKYFKPFLKYLQIKHDSYEWFWISFIICLNFKESDGLIQFKCNSD